MASNIKKAESFPVAKQQEPMHHDPKNMAGLCDYCGHRGVRRSHRKNIFERLRSRLTGTLPFRCTYCNQRFWEHVDPRDI